MPEAIKPTLAELCTDIFILILKLRDTVDYGDPETLRRRLKEILDRLDRQARNAQIEIASLQQARFALVAFIDETILSSQWNYKGLWMGKTLNSEFYGKSDAGDEFFTRLNELRQRVQAHAEIIEVYYQCLVLGYKGRYFSKPEQLRMLMEDIYDSLRNLTDKHTSPNQIAPNPLPVEHTMAKPRTTLSWGWLVSGAIAVILIFFIVLKFIITSKANTLL